MFPRNNNLEWLRLIFAAQVVFSHVASHMGLIIPDVISHFPGVPAFFFVSGFLIYASYLNSPGWRYFQNRFLRLYPGLVFVTVGGLIVALTARGWDDFLNNLPAYALWFIAQSTLGQAYTPEIFREIGVGVINGSLWTLTVEIMFYLIVPIIVWFEARFRQTVLLLLSLSFLVYVFGPLILNKSIYHNKSVYDFMALTPIVWGWMFAFGILAVKHFNLVHRWIKYFPFVIVPLTVMIAIGDGPFFASASNRLGILYFSCYVGLILWFAFATPFVRLKFDLSYGSYVWHMPVINMLLVLSIPSVPLAFALTFVIASLSWFLIEKPALKLKRKSLNPIE